MAMLRHLYGSSYDTQEELRDDAMADFHLSVFILGDKYDIGSIRDQAFDCFVDFLAEEREAEEFFDQTIYAIQKLLGPDAPQLADQRLTEYTSGFVLENLYLLLSDKTFRNLLAEGIMLKKDLAIQFLETVHSKL
jgi:hypothetical protein